MEDIQKKDHDILITLVANVANLSKSQEDFHKEVRDSFKSLENNYSAKIEILESRVKGIEFKNMWYTGALAVIGICSSLVLYIYFGEQKAQNLQIEQLIEIQNKLTEFH